MSWKKVKLSELCNMNSGGTPSRAIKEYYIGDIPWAKISDIENAQSGIIKNTEEHISKAGLDSINNRIFPKGTLLLAMYGSVGKAAFTGIEMSTNQAILGIRIKDENTLDYSFLKYWFQTIKTQLLNRAVGGTLQNISLGIVKDLQIPLPPLPTQKRIAEILDAADALRRKDQELLRKYDELAQAIFIDMFGDPVKNEKGWDRIPFAELFDSRLGKMLDAKKQVGGKKFKYLGNSNLQWFRFNLDNLLEMEFADNEIEKFELKKGDILICEGGEVGRCAIWNNDMPNVYFQKAIHRARAISNNITPEYTVMLFWFLAKYGGLNDYVTAATIAHLTGEKLKLIPIPVPPIDLQIKYRDVVLQLNKQNELFAVSQLHSENIFNSLLQQAFKGELVK